MSFPSPRENFLLDSNPLLTEMSIKDYEPKSIDIPESWGEKTTASDLVNEVVQVLDYRELERVSEDNRPLYVVHVLVESSNKHKWFFTSSGAIIRALEQAPFRARIVRRKSKKSPYRYIAFEKP